MWFKVPRWGTGQQLCGGEGYDRQTPLTSLLMCRCPQHTNVLNMSYGLCPAVCLPCFPILSKCLTKNVVNEKMMHLDGTLEAQPITLGCSACSLYFLSLLTETQAHPTNWLPLSCALVKGCQKIVLCARVFCSGCLIPYCARGSSYLFIYLQGTFIAQKGHYCREWNKKWNIVPNTVAKKKKTLYRGVTPAQHNAKEKHKAKKKKHWMEIYNI